MSGARVLVVDDQDPIRTLVAQFVRLVDGTVEVASAADGHEALDQVGRFDPDLIVLDLDMPGPSGFDVCAEVRRRPGKKVTVIAMSGNAAEERRRRMAELGADHFLGKPFTFAAFKAAFGESLRRPARDRSPHSPLL